MKGSLLAKVAVSVLGWWLTMAVLSSSTAVFAFSPPRSVKAGSWPAARFCLLLGPRHGYSSLGTRFWCGKTHEENAAAVKVGDLLGDLPSPCLLLELSLAEAAAASALEDKDGEAAVNPSEALDRLLALEHWSSSSWSFLEGAVFVHTTVTDTSERELIAQKEGSGKAEAIGLVDASPTDHLPGGAYLGIGLANHHAGGYYWARGMGMGASLPAHGIGFGPPSTTTTTAKKKSTEGSGRLFWRKRGPGQDAQETTEESSNSNDGKRSEWADFLVPGDTVQLVPEDTTQVLEAASAWEVLVGVRRIGRPLGADPIVERTWARRSDGSWAPTE